MFIIISPSKTQDFSKDFSKEISGGKISEADFSTSVFNSETKKIAKITKNISVKDLEKIMNISSKLAKLNFERFQKWNGVFNDRKKKKTEYFNFSPAIFAFKGDVYLGFDLEDWNKKDFDYAEKNLKIISGFYGILTPLNFLKPYRLEMSTKVSLKIGKSIYKNLYDFWREKITFYLLEKFNEKKERVLVNLASMEYSKVIDRTILVDNGVDILDIDFKVSKNGIEKIIAIFAKRARGDMANWIIKNKIKEKNDIKKFSVDNWKFSSKDSSKSKFVFLKKK